MKRSLILLLCAVALAAIGISAAQATVDVALNLRYTDPFDPSEGGTWTLVAKSDANGIVGLVVRFLDMPASGTVNASIGHDINDPNNALVIGTFGLETEFVYGQDPNDGLVANVGLSTGPSNDPVDNLNNPAWNNASIIATGTIADLTTRPTFMSAAANEADPNDVITASAIGLTNIRGDSVGVDGLLTGDANRNGTVGAEDVSALSGGFGGAGGWDVGDFNDNDIVGAEDVSSLSGNFNLSSTPPAIGAVPEPTSLALLALAGLGIALRRRVL